MMQRFSIYLSVILLVLTSCVKEVKDSSVLPISGMWVELNEDMSVAKLIEFKDGAYIEYAPRDEVKFYYHDYKVWQASLDDFNSKKYQYAVVGDDLILGNPQTPTAHLTKSISLKDDKLYLQGKEYQFIKELTTAYGSELSTSVDNLENIQYSPSAQEITWEYTVSNNPGGIKLVATCEESWVKNIRVDENKVRLSIEENLTSYKREAVVSLCHPATVDKTIKFAQLFYINLSTVETLAPENVSYTQAILKGAVIDDGNSAIQQYGFYLGSDPNHLQKYIVELNDKATFILEVNHLQDATTYYYKAFAVNEIGETHGELKSFTTQKYYLPTIQTLPATDIAASSAILNGKIIDNGGADIQECGFYYGTSQPPSADGIRKSIINVSDSFSILVNGLTDNTIFYLQLFHFMLLL